MWKFLKNTSSFTSSFTYNFQLISAIYCIFSNKQSKHLFPNWPLTWAAHSGEHLIEVVAYSTIEKNYN